LRSIIVPPSICVVNLGASEPRSSRRSIMPIAHCGLAHSPEGPSPGTLFDPSQVSRLRLRTPDSGLRTPDT
jgi:hypothetical protein